MINNVYVMSSGLDDCLIAVLNLVYQHSELKMNCWVNDCLASDALNN